jgi:hypothetical protein
VASPCRCLSPSHSQVPFPSARRCR